MTPAPPAPAARLCARCGAPLPPGATAQRLYCSRKCGKKASYEAAKAAQPPPTPITATCAACGRTFEYIFKGPTQRYCSRRCHARREQAARYGPGGTPVEQRACPVCGAAFQVKASSTQKYCTPACRRKAGRARARKTPEPVTATCAACGRTFQYHRRGRPRRFCSEGCYRPWYKALDLPPLEPSAPDLHPPIPPWPSGSLSSDVQIAALPPTACAICGRPPHHGEDTAQWRVRVGKYRPGCVDQFYLICPNHYGPYQPRPSLLSVLA